MEYERKYLGILKTLHSGPRAVLPDPTHGALPSQETMIFLTNIFYIHPASVLYTLPVVFSTSLHYSVALSYSYILVMAVNFPISSQSSLLIFVTLYFVFWLTGVR